VADFELVRATVEAAAAKGIAVRTGLIHSADLFYNPVEGVWDLLDKMGVLAVEMEAAGLYGVAAEFGARALTIATVSDHVRTGEATSSDERQSTFDDMVVLALEALAGDAGR
jgi:purine-nucleoside phosphorylase